MGSLTKLAVWLALTSAACQAPRTRAGSRWHLFTCGVEQSLRGLAAVSRDVCYVGGSGGTLRKTADGGATWSDVAPAGSAGCDFRDVEVIGPGVVVALVAGTPARLYRSADGGETWAMVHEDPRRGAFFDAVAFDGEHGVVFGDAIEGRFVLLESRDAGRTWRDVPSPALPEPSGEEAAFAASGTCLVAGPRGFSLVTGGGSTRHVSFRPGAGHEFVELPLRRGAASRGAFSVAWSGARGVCVGGDYMAPEQRRESAAFSADGGRSWRAADAGGFRSGAVWISERDVLAVGSHGASWSTDAGRTFSAFGDAGFHSVARAGDGAVWACGADGRVGRLGRRTPR